MRLLVALLLLPGALLAQDFQFPLQTLPLNDLSGFRPVAKNWRIAGDVSADPAKDEAMTATPGAGVLVNLPDDKNHDNLVSVLEHGDLDLEVDVMMARHSNSGIYLQGRYEIQLLDSWGKVHPKYGDMAGIYQRWDDSKPEAQKGYLGVAPSTNAAKAPGLWQHLRIEFQAPRFDASGRKTANARILKVVLNGVTVHENVELTGPTRGPMAPNEVATGPLLIQGDHGPVAFRNMRYRAYGGQPVVLTNLKYESLSWERNDLPADFSKEKVDVRGDLNPNGITWEVAKGNNDFATRFTGTLRVAKAGRYNISMFSPGAGSVKIGGELVLKPGPWSQTESHDLPSGDLPIEVVYAKHESWIQPALGVFIEGLDFRPTALHQPSSLSLDEPVSPIFLEPQGRRPELLRSFLDVQTRADQPRKRIVHPISVGYPDGPSYSYDLDCGRLIQVWNGAFLETTPMWHDRGDGHADPRGAVAVLGLGPQLAPATVAPADSVAPEANYHLSGYSLDAEGSPSFEYKIYGADVKDQIRPASEGKTLSRELSISGGNALLFRAAVAANIASAGPNLWVVGDKQYFIQTPPGVKAQVQSSNGQQVLVLPVTNGKVQYEVIW